MKTKRIKKEIKKFWDWVCDLDSIFKWIIILFLICVVVMLTLLLILPLIFGNSLILAGVESSSMSHQMKITGNDSGELKLCGNIYSEQERKKGQAGFDEYWEACGDWYEQKNISKQTFYEFPLKNGFNKGDMIIVWETPELKIGDIIVFKKNLESTSKPIIHRIVNIEDNIIQTKGDGLVRQSSSETNITQEQIIGKGVFRIPFLGWPKIWVGELMDGFD